MAAATAERNQWGCVGCLPPHWENGVYVDRLTVHPKCLRHNPERTVIGEEQHDVD